MTTVLPFELPLVKYPESTFPLYHHQAAVYDSWEEHSAFLLITKTGTGKTTAAMLPILRKRLNTICVYPTNELIKDQARSIFLLAKEQGIACAEYSPETSNEEFSIADTLIVKVDSENLELWRKKWRKKTKSEALERLLYVDKPRIILTNPDILFLIFSLKFRSGALANVTAYDALVLDEFHLYTGVEFAHALFMVHLGRSLGAFSKVLLLSATPAVGTQKYLDALLENPLRIDMNTRSIRPASGNKLAVDEVHIIPVEIGNDPVETAIHQIEALKSEIQQLRVKHKGDFVPAVVVFNSVANAIRFEDAVVERRLFKREELRIVRGRTSRLLRQDTDEKSLVIGTSAIEVGVDFYCRILVFEALEAPSFMQRFGRVGRHEPGTAYVLCPPRVAQAIEKLPENITRDEYEEKIYTWYPAPDGYSWFTETYYGLFTVFAVAESVISRCEESAPPEQLERIRETMHSMVKEYAKKIGVYTYFDKIRFKFNRARAGAEKFQWYLTYQDLNTFRTSFPSVYVYDRAERNRRGGDYELAKYSVDLMTLVKWADNIRFNERLLGEEGEPGIVEIQGYGRRKKKVSLHTHFERKSEFYRSKAVSPPPYIYQDNHPTPVWHLLHFKDHVLLPFRKDAPIEPDWRLPIFDQGEYYVAIDGTALLIYEMLRKKGAIQ